MNQIVKTLCPAFLIILMVCSTACIKKAELMKLPFIAHNIMGNRVDLIRIVTEVKQSRRLWLVHKTLEQELEQEHCARRNKEKRIVKIVKNGYLRSGWPFSSSSKTEPGSAALDWKNDEAPVNSEKEV